MRNKNEPAYPVQTGFGVGSKGMNKRELIAAMAMQGVLSGCWGNPEMSGLPPHDIAQESVAYADALLEALND